MNTTPVVVRGNSWRGVLFCCGFLLSCVALAVLGLLPLLCEPIAAGQPVARQRPVVNPPNADANVWCLAISADGKFLVGSAGKWDQSGEIGVWNLATKEPLQRFAEELGVASVVLSPDGKWLASGSWSGHVRVSDWEAGRELFDLPIGDVAHLAMSPDGKVLAAVTEDKRAQLWDLAEGKLLADLQGSLLRFHYVTFSPDGKRLLAGGGDWKEGGTNEVTVWDVASKQQVQKLTGHENAILSIACSPNGRTIATGAVDSTIRLWQADSGECLKTLEGHEHFVQSVTFSADGKTLLSGSLDGTARFWDVETGQEREEKRLHLRGGVSFARFTPDGNVLIGGHGKTLKLYAAAKQQELAVLWNGAEPGTVAMERFPIVYPMPQVEVQEKGSTPAVCLLALGFAFLASLGFTISLSLLRRRDGQAPSNVHSAALSFPCLECGKSLKVKVELAGKKIKCPNCGKPTPVPHTNSGEVSIPAPRRARPRWDLLTAGTVSGILAVLLLVGIGLSRGSGGSDAPYMSRLQILADRVKAKKSDTIDARPYPGLNDKDLVALVGLSNLKNLNLDNSDVTDAGLKEVAGVGTLLSLSLTHTRVSNDGLALLKPLTALEDLRLDQLPITDAGLAHLGAFPRLKSLSLYQTGVTDKGMVYLKQLTALERLSLDDTSVGDEGLRHLSACVNLKYVSLWKTQVTPTGIQALSTLLPRLKVNR